MSTISSISGKSLGSSSDGQSPAEVVIKRSTYLCPKCNRKYEVQTRSGSYYGRVPLILNCTHNICEECVRTSLNLSQVVSCPECHEKSSVVDKNKIQQSFQVNFHLLGDLQYSRTGSLETSSLQMKPTGMRYKDRNNSTIEEREENYASYIKSFTSQAALVEKCSQTHCKRTATLTCIECNEVFCEACSNNLHRSARGLQKHQILSVTSPVVPELTTKCSEHTKQALEFNCTTCNKLLCCYCILAEHSDHSYVMLSNLNEKDRPNFNQLIEDVEEKVKRFILTHKKVENELSNLKKINFKKENSTELEIARCFANLHAKLQYFENKILYKVTEAKNKNITTLENLKDEIASNIQTSLSLLKSAKDINNSNVKINVQVLSQRLNNILSNPCYLLGEMENSNVSFQFDDTCLDFEESFTVTQDSILDTYRLVGEDEIPDGYDTSLPANIAELSLEDIAAEKTRNFSVSSSTDSYASAQTSAHQNKTNSMANEPKFTRRLANVKYTGVPMPKKDERESVSVTHINSPESFYVQLARFANAFEKFSRDINQFVKTTAFVEKPELNQLYFVKYVAATKRPEWSRGRVLAIKKNNLDEPIYEVIFIDFGTSKTVTSKMIKEIPPEFVKPKPFALHCKLHNTFPINQWDERSMKLMAQIVNNNSCLILVINNEAGILEVELYVTSGSDNMASVRDALIFIGHAVPSLDPASPLSSVRVKPVLPMRNLTTNTDAFRKEKSLEVIISYVIDPEDLYVQQVPLLHQISHLSENMAKYYMEKGLAPGQNNSNIYAPSKDMAVALQTKDFNSSKWHRGIITNVTNGQGLVEVFLVDYGKTITALYTQLRQLPDRFRQTSCQAINVKMAHIMPCGGEVWGNNAIQYLRNLSENKERLRLTVAEVNRKSIEVILFETHALVDVCLNSLMVKEGLAESTGELSTQVEWHKDNIEKPKQKIEPVFSLIKMSNDSDASEGESDGDDSSVPKKFVRILLVKNPGLIYAAFEDQTVSAIQTKLFHDLQLFYNTKHKSANPEATIGTICVVLHREKAQYFRAIVTDKLENGFLKVLLRDVAEELKVPIGDVYVMEPQFRQICEGSFRCHLADLTPAGDPNKWSSTSIDFLNDVFLKGKILLAKNGLVDKDRKSLPVVMWYTEFKAGGALEPSRTILHNINNLLVNRGLALKSTVLSSGSSFLDALSKVGESVNTEEVSSSMQDEQPKISQEIDTATDQDDTNKSCTDAPVNETAKAIAAEMEENDASNQVSQVTSVLTLDWLPPEPFSRTQFDAIATYVDNYANIYIHDVSIEDNFKKMEASMKAIFDIIPPEPKSTVWVVGQLCTVRYSITSCWYRGKIVSINGNIINVFLIDYGNVEECGHEDLRSKILYTEIPSLANKIHLHKVVCKSDKWWTSDLDELHATVVDKRISVVLKGDVRSNTSLPAKILIGGIHVNKEIVHLSKNLQYGYNKIIDDDDEVFEDVVVEGEIYENDDIDEQRCYNQVVLNENCKGKKLRVSIISVCNHNTFIFEVINDTMISEQKNLFLEISNDIKLNGYKQPPLQNFEVGQACIAIFSEDKEFYRAQIEASVLQGLVLVWFVDFGNFEYVPVESVRKIQQKWLTLPILQYRGEIPDIKCAYSEGEKYDSLIEQLSELCNTHQDAEIINVDPLLIRLYTPNGVLSYQSLITNGSLIK